MAAIRDFHDAGFRKLDVVPVGDDVEGTLDCFESEVKPRLDLDR